MGNRRLHEQARDIAACYFRHDKTPSYGEICQNLRDNYGDAIFIPRFGAMVLSKLNEYRAAFAA
jgi:hypothetical protein